MKIKVDYNKLDQSEFRDGPFIFIKEAGIIKNLEARW